MDLAYEFKNRCPIDVAHAHGEDMTHDDHEYGHTLHYIEIFKALFHIHSERRKTLRPSH